MHNQGLEGLPQNILTFLTSESSKWVRMAVRSNRMHNQGLDGRPQNILAFLMSQSYFKTDASAALSLQHGSDFLQISVFKLLRHLFLLNFAASITELTLNHSFSSYFLSLIGK